MFITGCDIYKVIITKNYIPSFSILSVLEGSLRMERNKQYSFYVATLENGTQAKRIKPHIEFQHAECLFHKHQKLLLQKRNLFEFLIEIAITELHVRQQYLFWKHDK